MLISSYRLSYNRLYMYFPVFSYFQHISWQHMYMIGVVVTLKGVIGSGNDILVIVLYLQNVTHHSKPNVFQCRIIVELEILQKVDTF